MKDVKKSRENHIVNVSTKSKIKTITKKTKLAIDEKSDNIAALMSESFSVIDKAAQRGIIHPNQAARRKARLTKKLAKNS